MGTCKDFLIPVEFLPAGIGEHGTIAPMSHIVEVDQSIRFDDTSDDTVVAYANGIRHSVLIPSTVKRECLRVLRGAGYRARNLYIQLFSTTLYFLLRDNMQMISHVVIDLEYPGKDAQIRERLLNLLRRDGRIVEPEQIEFASVGKGSPAHKLALDTLRRREQPDLVLTVEYLLREFPRMRKKGK